MSVKKAGALIGTDGQGKEGILFDLAIEDVKVILKMMQPDNAPSISDSDEDESGW